MAFAVTKAAWSERLLILFAVLGLVVIAVCFSGSKPKAEKRTEAPSVIVVPTPPPPVESPQPSADREPKLHHLV